MAQGGGWIVETGDGKDGGGSSTLIVVEGIAVALMLAASFIASLWGFA